MEKHQSIGTTTLEKPKEPLLLGIRDLCEKYTHGMWKIIGKHMHPNQITSARLGIGATALGLHASGHTDLGTALFAANCAVDWVDGAVARATPTLQTTEGAKLDPLVDKGVNCLSLVYLASHHADDIPLCAAAAASMAIDYFSQRQRGPILEQVKEGMTATFHPETCEKASSQEIKKVQANVYGKIKFFLQSMAIGTVLLAGNDQNEKTLATMGLAVASGLGIMGTLKRKKS